MSQYVNIDKVNTYLNDNFKGIDHIICFNGGLSKIKGTVRMRSGLNVKFSIVARKNGIFVDFLDEIKKVD